MPPYTGPRGTGFTSLADYLNLNREAANRMGGELVGDVESRGQAAQQAISDYGADFTKRVAAGIPGYSEEGVGSSADAAARAAGATYGGPTEWDAARVSELGRQANEAAFRARLGTSDVGRGMLLQERYAPTGGYTAGASGLDAFLAGRGAGAQAAAQASRWNELQNQLAQGQQAGRGAAQGARTAAEGVAGQYQALGAGWAGKEKEAKTKATAAAEQAKASARANRREVADVRGRETTGEGYDYANKMAGNVRRREDETYVQKGFRPWTFTKPYDPYTYTLDSDYVEGPGGQRIPRPGRNPQKYP